jgi:hypothetical protein
VRGLSAVHLQEVDRASPDGRRLRHGRDRVSITDRFISFDDAGNVTTLAAAYSQRVGAPDAPAWSGLLRYNGAPRSFTVAVARHSACGLVRQENHGDPNRSTLTGGSPPVYFEAPVLRDFRSVVIAPRAGQALQAGRCGARGEPSARFAALNVGRGLDSPLYCPDTRGLVDIRGIAYDDSGRVSALRARFEYRCSPVARRCAARSGSTLERLQRPAPPGAPAPLARAGATWHGAGNATRCTVAIDVKKPLRRARQNRADSISKSPGGVR